MPGDVVGRYRFTDRH